MLIQETERVLNKVDVVLGGDDLVRTNLTGHPSMVVRFGSQEMPASKSETDKDAKEQAAPKVMAPRVIKLTAKYFNDAWLVTVADYLERQMPSIPSLPKIFEARRATL